MSHGNHISNKCAAAAVFMLTLFSLPAQATTWESGKTLLATARRALPMVPHGIARGMPPHTDGWLRACAKPLRTRVTAQSQWASTVKVSCPAPGWSLYLSFQWRYQEKAVTALHFLPSGAVIHRNDIRMKTVDITAQTGLVCTQEAMVIGQDARANVPAGSLVSPQDIEPPLLVRQGQRVLLEARFGSIVSRAMGTALNDGREGQSLLVRNNASHKVLSGVVARDGDVMLSPGGAS